MLWASTIALVNQGRRTGKAAPLPAFLDRFVVTGRGDGSRTGEDSKYDGGARAAAEAVAHAVKGDVLAVQTLYGKQHGH